MPTQVTCQPMPFEKIPSVGLWGGRFITFRSAGSTPMLSPSSPSVIRLSHRSWSGSRATTASRGRPVRKNSTGHSSITSTLPMLPATANFTKRRRLS